MTTIRPAPTCLQSRCSTCSLCFRKFTQAGGINAGEVSIVTTVWSSVSPALKSVFTSWTLLRRSDIAEHPPAHFDTAIPVARPVSVVPHMADPRQLIDSFWQGSVVSVGACIRARHRRRAGGYRSRHRRFTRTPPARNVSVKRARARILGLHERYLPADERTGGGRRALFRHRGPFGGLHRDEPRCPTARDRRHHLRGASRGSPDTGRTA